MTIESSISYKIFKNSIPGDCQFNQLSKHQELTGRLLITGLITGSETSPHLPSLSQLTWTFPIRRPFGAYDHTPHAEKKI
jgi:hypothetical protein